MRPNQWFWHTLFSGHMDDEAWIVFSLIKSLIVRVVLGGGISQYEVQLRQADTFHAVAF